MWAAAWLLLLILNIVCDRSSTRNVIDSKLVGSQLTTPWLVTRNSLPRTLVILVFCTLQISLNIQGWRICLEYIVFQENLVLIMVYFMFTCFGIMKRQLNVTTWKVFLLGVILVRIFPHSDSSILSPNTGKCGPE